MRKRSAKKSELAVTDEYGFSVSEAFVLNFDTDEELFAQGQRINWFLFILKGSADVQVHAPGGGKLAFGYSLDSGCLGEIELLGGKDIATTTVVAITPVEALAIPWDQMKAEVKRNIALSNCLGQNVAQSFVDLEQNYLHSLLATGEQRLCSYILRKARNGVFRNTLSETASVIGVSYRHIFRIMSKLCEDGVLEKKPDGYHLLDEEALTVMAVV